MVILASENQGLSNLNRELSFPIVNILYCIEKIWFEGRNAKIAGWCLNADNITINGKGGAFSRIDRPDVDSHIGSTGAFGFELAAEYDGSAQLELGFEPINSEFEPVNIVVLQPSDNKNIKDNYTLSTIETRDLSSNKIEPMHEKNVANEVLIVGSAPTINHFIDDIKTFKGEIWALNDAWFWLEENDIEVNNVFVTDSRFFSKVQAKLGSAKCKKIITIDTVDLALLEGKGLEILVFKCLGRDGFSLKYGEVYHNCSVFFSALQTAFSSRFNKVFSCGVLLQNPMIYKRIDGSGTMPEYVYNIQINNAHKAKYLMDMYGIYFSAFEKDSMLNFL